MQFYEKIYEIQALIIVANPNKDDVDRLLDLIQYDITACRFFYENCKNQNWLILLLEKGQFKHLCNLKDEVGEEEWAYLMAIAKKEPQKVLDIILNANSQNHLIQGRLLMAINSMPLEQMLAAVPTIIRYLKDHEKKDWYFIGEKSAEIMLKIAEFKKKEAFQIAKELFEVWKPNESRRISPYDIDSRFSSFEYRELIRNYFPVLTDADAFLSINMLFSNMKSFLDSLDERELSSLAYSLFIHLDNIENAHVGNDDILISIVAAITNASKILIETNSEKISDLFKMLDTSNYLLTKRIQMHLLRFVPKGYELERINAFLMNENLMFDEGCWHEYRLLLRDKFDETEQSIRDEFKNRIKEIAFDKEERKGFFEWFKRTKGIEATEGDIKAFEKRRQAQELYLVRDRYPAFFNLNYS